MLTEAWHHAALANTSKVPKKPEDLWTTATQNVIPIASMIEMLRKGA